MSDDESSTGAPRWLAWRDQAIYRAVTSLAPEDAAWEILRRNEAYQDAFRRWQAGESGSDPGPWGLVVFGDPWE
ncbi:MAG: hypothetical protein JNK67_13775 [Alphaproteobacteria bacterium]|nr:hypothetical protein [Alphaproteobacteria bacterium]